MEEQEQNLLAHLQALRNTLIKCLAALAVGFVPMFLTAPYVIKALSSVILSKNPIGLNYFAPLEVFMLQIKFALVLDLLLCAPYLAHRIWLFIAPALYENERRFVRSLVGVSSGLFIIGVWFCLFLIMPMLINFGLSFSTLGLTAMFGISNVLGLALWLSVIFGLMFQFPLITYTLIRCEIVSAAAVKNKRPYVFVGILILSALLTPPDIISQLLLTLPTYLLFEAGLYFGAKTPLK